MKLGNFIECLQDIAHRDDDNVDLEVLVTVEESGREYYINDLSTVALADGGSVVYIEGERTKAGYLSTDAADALGRRLKGDDNDPVWQGSMRIVRGSKGGAKQR